MCDLSPLELCMGIQLGVFTQYAGSDDRITKDKFKKLVKEMLPTISGHLTPECEETIFKSTDLNDDGFVTFLEFSSLISAMCAAQMETFKEMSKAAQAEQKRRN